MAPAIAHIVHKSKAALTGSSDLEAGPKIRICGVDGL